MLKQRVDWSEDSGNIHLGERLLFPTLFGNSLYQLFRLHFTSALLTDFVVVVKLSQIALFVSES